MCSLALLPNLSKIRLQGHAVRTWWTHYRELLAVHDPEARSWYESEAGEQGWSRTKLVQAIRAKRFAERPPAEGKGNGKARDYVQDRLATVELVVIQTVKIDLYGRYVAHVFYQPDEADKRLVASNGLYLNQELVEQDLARAL